MNEKPITKQRTSGLQGDLLRLLAEATPYDNAERYARVEANIPRLEAESGPRAAEYVRIQLELARTSTSTDAAIERYLRLRDADVTLDYVTLQAANEIARLTFNNPRFTHEQNDSHRRMAIELARRLGDRRGEVVLMSNWMSALLERRDLEGARALERPIELALSNLSPQERESNLIIELRSRYAAHRARLHLANARNAPLEQRQPHIEQARSLYTEAVALVRSVDHRRVNTQIEWAREWTSLFKDGLLPDATEARAIVEKAHRALDAHDCEPCKAFYQYVQSALLDARGDRLFNEDRRQAVELWKEACLALKESTASYTRSGHHFVQTNDEYLASLEAKLTMNTLPPRIFLSHKSVNKPRVRELKAVLNELGFEAWLDDDSMTAGVELTASIIEGIESSCAAVFFVTPEFTDEGFIGKEIAHAVDCKRRKGNDFAIIALIWGEATSVPASLQDYVCKRVTSEFEALREILRALPVRVGSAVWKNAPIRT